MDTERRFYKFVERGSGPKWNVQLYSFYGDGSPSEAPNPRPMGTGPYCTSWVRVKAGDRKAAEAELAADGVEAWR